MTRRAFWASYLALWAATAAGAGLALAGERVVTVPAPHPGLAPTLRSVAELLAHNAPVALWPLALVALGWPALAGVRRVADALIAAQLLAHGVLLGSGLGQHPTLWRFLPHLPLEWLAIATPAAAWLTARARPARTTATPGAVALLAGASLGALLGAAAIETYLVPVT